MRPILMSLVVLSLPWVPTLVSYAVRTERTADKFVATMPASDDPAPRRYYYRPVHESDQLTHHNGH